MDAVLSASFLEHPIFPHRKWYLLIRDREPVEKALTTQPKEERKLSLNDPTSLKWERIRIRKAKAGDVEAYAEIYKRFAALVFAQVLLPKLGNRAAAQDALSETFRIGFERLSQFTPSKVSIYFWFARIASNKATDMHRASTRSRRALASFEGLFEPIRAHVGLPDEALDRKEELLELKRRIGIVFEALNPRYRQALELRFLQGLSRQECADALEVKLGTFDVLLLRALKSFRKSWENTGSL